MCGKVDKCGESETVQTWKDLPLTKGEIFQNEVHIKRSDMYVGNIKKRKRRLRGVE